MIVCVCNAISDRSVRKTLATAPEISSPAAVHRAHGCKAQCGRCLPSLAELISEAKLETALASAVQAAD